MISSRTPSASQGFFAEQVEAGWSHVLQSLASIEESHPCARHGVSGGGRLASLAAAHSRYASAVRRNMFAGTDRPGAAVRTCIEDLYDVVGAVSRLTDDLASESLAAAARHERGLRGPESAGGEGARALVSDGALLEATAMRKRFEATRERMCGALSDIDGPGGSPRTESLLAILGYGGYGDDATRRRG